MVAVQRFEPFFVFLPLLRKNNPNATVVITILLVMPYIRL